MREKQIFSALFQISLLELATVRATAGWSAGPLLWKVGDFTTRPYSILLNFYFKIALSG